MKQAAEAAKDELKRFFSNCGRLLAYDKNELIIRSYDPPAGVYSIGNGFVKAYTITDDGEENVHQLLAPGDIFPITWAFTSEWRGGFYQALDQVSVYRVSRAEFLEYLSGNPHALGIFIFKLIVMYQTALERIEVLEYRRAPARVVAGIINLAFRFGHGKPLRVELPLSHADIGAMVNVSRETVSRVISRLERTGALKQTETGLVILKPKFLKTMLSS